MGCGLWSIKEIDFILNAYFEFAAPQICKVPGLKFKHMQLRIHAPESSNVAVSRPHTGETKKGRYSLLVPVKNQQMVKFLIC